MSGDTSRTGRDTTSADARRGKDLNVGRSIGRQWAELLATNGQFRDRLWAESHGRRQPLTTTILIACSLGGSASRGGRSAVRHLCVVACGRRSAPAVLCAHQDASGSSLLPRAAYVLRRSTALVAPGESALISPHCPPKIARQAVYATPLGSPTSLVTTSSSPTDWGARGG